MLGETKMQPNTTFCDTNNEPVCRGWLPAGYIPSADLDSDFDYIDFPFIVWAKARSNDGKEWFNRLLRRYSFPKNKITPENRFMQYDEYLDTNAAALLNTNNIRLVRRYPLDDAEYEKLKNEIIEARDSFARFSSPDLTYIVQSSYGGSGAKLYEANVGGQKKYLVLTARIIASEYGTFNKQLYEIQLRNRQLLNSSRNMFGGGYFGNNLYNQPEPQPLQFDTDPYTPFGQHRTDNLTSAMLLWKIYDFAGFISPVEPTENEIRDFLSFAKSFELHEHFKNFIDKIQQQLIMNEMQANQMLFNGMQQTLKVQQQSFDRSFNAMRSVSDMGFEMTQHRMAVDNAAFDRQVRHNHEAVMGVNTYQRTDGSTVEASVMNDRVFQRTGDPTTVAGVSGAGPDIVPFGWTELKKLR